MHILYRQHQCTESVIVPAYRVVKEECTDKDENVPHLMAVSHEIKSAWPALLRKLGGVKNKAHRIATEGGEQLVKKQIRLNAVNHQHTSTRQHQHRCAVAKQNSSVTEIDVQKRRRPGRPTDKVAPMKERYKGKTNKGREKGNRSPEISEQGWHIRPDQRDT